MSLLSLVGPVIGAVTSVIGGNSAKKANSRAIAAQNAATDKQIAVQQANLDRIQGLQQPFINVGYSALDKIAAKYGLPTSSGQPATPARTSSYRSPTYNPAANQPVTSRAPLVQPYDPTGGVRRDPPPGALTGAPLGGVDPGKAAARTDGGSAYAGTPDPSSYASDTFAANGGSNAAVGNAGADTIGGDGPDWGAYLNTNPDVAGEFERLNSTPEGQATLQANGITSPEDFASHHYATAGQAEGRAVTQYAPEQAPQAPAEPGRPTFETPQYTRPDQPVWQDMGNGPSSADYLDPSKFTTSPGYQFRLNEGNRNLNASYGAKGLLKSGGAIKGFTDYNQGMASSEFDKWFQQGLQRLNSDRGQFNADRQANFNIFNTNRQNTNANFDTDRAVGLTQFNNDRSFTNNNFENDRTFNTNREDTATNNLFRLTGIGTDAASSVGGASTNAANNATNIYGQQGDNNASRALANGAANGATINAIGGAASNIFSRYANGGVGASGGAGGTTVGSAWDNYTGGGFVQPTSANFVNRGISGVNF